jgi:predicted nucleotidyltransferase
MGKELIGHHGFFLPATDRTCTVKSMIKKKYPAGGAIRNLRVITALSNFVLQGTRYMSYGERVYKISATILFSCLLYLTTDIGPVWSLIGGHFLNFAINGQAPVLLRYMSSNGRLKKADVEKSLTLLADIGPFFDVKELLIFGSFCRGEMNGSSDLDVRVYHDKSVLSSLKAYIFATTVRFWGALSGFPIDIYCFSDVNFLKKMRADEIPCYLFSNRDFICIYPTAKPAKDVLKENHGLK